MDRAVGINPEFNLSLLQQDLKGHLAQPNKDNPILSKANLHRIDPEEVIKPLETAIKLGESSLFTLGNFSLIMGKAKSRKSFFLGVLSSVLLVDDLFGFCGTLPREQRKILYFDTEQAKFHVQRAFRRIRQMTSGNNLEYIDIFHLRTLQPKERLEMIEAVIYSTSDLGFVFIDGIRDLVTSINDEEQATFISSKLLKWSEELNIHISVVLHQNKSDNNARGHLGTELINKAETVLSVAKSEGNSDISIVTPELCRDKEPDVFAFEIIDGLPAIADNYEIRTETSKNRFNMSDLGEWQIYSLLAETYSNGNEFGYSELVRQIKLAFTKQFGKSIGDNRAKDLVSIAKNNNWLIQETQKGAYRLGKFKMSEDEK